MDRSEFLQIGNQMFGGSKWGKLMSFNTGISQSAISDVITGKKPSLTQKNGDRVRAFVARHQGSEMVVQVDRPALNRRVAEAGIETIQAGQEIENGTVSFAGTKVGGDAKFSLKLMAKDLTSNRWVKAVDVNPALFFPEFAPQAQPMAPIYGLRASTALTPVANDDHLTDDEILAKTESRFRVMEQMVQAIIYQGFPAVIAYGAPGLGKSYSIHAALKAAADADPNFRGDVIKGSTGLPGLYKALYKARNGGVVLLDDSDNVFKDEAMLNLLKAATDSSDERIISNRKEASWLVDLATEAKVDLDEVQNFEFKGGVIFITNVNLRARIAANHSMSDHYKALISRSYYIDLALDSVRARMAWTRKKMNSGMGAKQGLTEEQTAEIVEFISVNRNRLNEVSLRMATQIITVYKANPSNWQEIIEVTKMEVA